MSVGQFPNGFLFGAATSAYQIEGVWNEDGKGESIWDRFSHTPGKISGGDTGDIACDHYHRFREDVAIMRTLGLKAYRFSVSWPRVLPQGRGESNPKGLDFYSRLVDALLEAGIEPFLTLYHWDLPQALQDKGGWPKREIVDSFCEYTQLMARSLGDRVRHWITLNEPHVSAFVGHLDGRHAPGHQDLEEALRAAHHHLLAHGLAVSLLRDLVPGARVGIVLNLAPVHPASRDLADRSAAWLADGKLNRWFLDPLAARGYPEDMVHHFNCPMDFVAEGDMDRVAVPIDFLGVNYYTRLVVRSPEAKLPQEVVPGGERTDMGWEVYPEGLYEILGRLHFDYRFPAYFVAENGAAYPDRMEPDGTVRDEKRIAYLRDHILQVHRAIAAGVPLRGYFVWSLLDNFEWAHGYGKRFGIVYVDFPTQKRIPKKSARFYARVIAKNGITLP